MGGELVGGDRTSVQTGVLDGDHSCIDHSALVLVW